MSGVSGYRDIGSIVKVQKGNDPANASAGTRNGAAIDRLSLGNPLSCVLHGTCGAATGTPSAQSVDLKLQDSADGSTGWADIVGAAITQLVANSTESEIDVDLSSTKRYLRTVEVVAFTGGTSPAIPVAQSISFGGQNKLPA